MSVGALSLYILVESAKSEVGQTIGLCRLSPLLLEPDRPQKTMVCPTCFHQFSKGVHPHCVQADSLRCAGYQPAPHHSGARRTLRSRRSAVSASRSSLCSVLCSTTFFTSLMSESKSPLSYFPLLS